MKPATRCRHASSYKAKSKPTCGCDVCAIKWLIAEVQRSVIETAESHERSRHEFDDWI